MFTFDIAHCQTITTLAYYYTHRLIIRPNLKSTYLTATNIQKNILLYSIIATIDTLFYDDKISVVKLSGCSQLSMPIVQVNLQTQLSQNQG